MWDIGGQESLRSAWNTYYTNTEVCYNAVIILYSYAKGYSRAAVLQNYCKSKSLKEKVTLEINTSFILFVYFTTHVTKKQNKSTKIYITEKVVRKP